MYFCYIHRFGIIAALSAMVATGHWALLGWAALILLYYWIQIRAPWRFDGSAARDVFNDAVLMQCMLAITAAVITQFAGAYLIAVGMIANTIAISANAGLMPILNDSSYNICYTEADEQSRVVWLCDIFRTTETSSHRWVVSVGDALECVGIWALAAELVVR